MLKSYVLKMTILQTIFKNVLFWKIYFFFLENNFYLFTMPQFDLNLLNFQNILVYIFCVSYLFYLKEINFYFFYFFKLPYQLNLYIFLFFIRKKCYVNNLFKFVLNILLLTFKKLKLLFFLLSVENHYFFYYII